MKKPTATWKIVALDLSQLTGIWVGSECWRIDVALENAITFIIKVGQKYLLVSENYI